LRYGHLHPTIFRRWAINFLTFRRPSNPVWA